ncbi:MAG: hypothetical protein WC399_01630 [Bacilli bacterium]|jgi:hypothetical protein
MNRYSLFYQPLTLGDVLLIIFEPEAFPTRSLARGDVHLIYGGERLIGVNIFNFMALAKVHAHGLLTNVPPVLIGIINDKLANDGIDVFLPPYQSGFRVARVVEKKTPSEVLVTLGHDVKVARGASGDLMVGQSVAVTLTGTLLPDGRVYHGQADEAMICSRKLFDPGLDDVPLLVDDAFKPGDDYFQWE